MRVAKGGRSAIKADEYWRWIELNKDRILASLAQYISIDTTSPNEAKAFPYLHDYLRGAGFATWEEPMHPAVFSHKGACPTPPSQLNSTSRNLKGKIRVTESGPTVLVSCHLDVVPAPTWPEAFSPRMDASGIVGRGACDTKGNLVMLAEAIRFLDEMKIKLAKNIEFDGVIEEEIGGNGALSTVLRGEARFEGVIVLEPTSLKCFRGHRGCLGFTVDIAGRGAHMSADAPSSGPVQAMCRLIDELADVEKIFTEEAIRDSAFAAWKRPIQVNVGRIEAGEWHGSAVDSCRIMVNMGFPHLWEINQVEAYVQALARKLEAQSGLRHAVTFNGIKNGAYLCETGDPFIGGFVDAMASAGISREPVHAWNASCDARTYAKCWSVPTIIFGAGHLSDAHSNHERLDFQELANGMLALASYFAGGMET